MGYRREIEILAPVEKVWRAWHSSIEVECWLAPKAHVEFHEGGSYEFFWGEDPQKDSTIGCKLLEIEPLRRLKFEWQGPAVFLHMFMPPKGKRTEVEVHFERVKDHTRVILYQLETRDIPYWNAYDNWMERAWGVALDSLKDYCEGVNVAKIKSTKA